MLFVGDAEERRKVAKACCLAWNIALFPDAAEREHHLLESVRLVTREDGGAPPAPPGFREGFAGELRMLADDKRDLFPWQIATVFDVELVPGPRAGVDVLGVDADGEVERIELAYSPSVMGAPIITGHLVRMRDDTKAQRTTLEEAGRTPGLLRQAVGWDMLTAYCAQRADLRGYHRMLTEWGDEADEDLKAGFGRFVAAVSEIEADTLAVLAILAGALWAPWER